MSRSSSRSTGASSSAPSENSSTARARAGSTGAGVRPNRPCDEIAELVDHRRVAVRRQHVQERLRRDDLPDRRGERRRPHLVAHLRDLVEHLVQAVRRPLSAELLVERADETDGKLLLRGPHRDARCDRRDGLVADVLVDELRSGPEHLQVGACREAEPRERLRRRLGRDAVHRQRDRIDGRRDHVGARARGFEGRSECVPARTLRVEADREARDVAQLGDELARAMRLQKRRRVVQEEPRRTELGKPLRGVDERLVAAAPVEQTRLELGARVDDRLTCLAQVVDVVQRVVQAEDVDAALRGARDEPPREVAADGARADEEAARAARARAASSSAP